MPLYSDHQVNLDKVQGHRGLGHGDLQQRLIACGPGAQVAKLHIGTRELNFFMKNLERRNVVDVLQLVNSGQVGYLQT